MVIGTFLGDGVEIPGDLAVVDDGKLLAELTIRCQSLGVQFWDKCALTNISWASNQIQAETSVCRINARFVLDCSGIHSPIANTFRLHRIEGFYSVYGARVTSIELSGDNVVLAYVNMLGHPPPILEVIPTGSDSAYCAVFVYSRSLVSPGSLEAAFHSHCAKNPFFKLTPRSRFESSKIGAIGIGKPSRRRLAGIAPFGDASLTHPPLLGTAFNDVLEYCKPACQHFDALLETGRLVRNAHYRFPLLKRAQDRFQLLLVRLLLDGNVEALHQFFRCIQKLPPDVAYSICAGDLTLRQLASAAIRMPAYLAADRMRIADNQ